MALAQALEGGCGKGRQIRVIPPLGVSQEESLESLCVARTLPSCPGAVLGSDPGVSGPLGGESVS